MLDRALARTLANLSTLILVAYVFTIPIHVVQAFMFQDALAVQEIASEIRSFPEGRQVRGVAKGDLEAERIALLVTLGLDLLLLPLAYRAARRVFEADDSGDVPGALDAWTHLSGSTRPALSTGSLVVAAAIGGGGALLVLLTGNRLADMASADLAWALYGLARATAAALFVAIVAGVAATSAEGTTRKEKAPVKIDLY